MEEKSPFIVIFIVGIVAVLFVIMFFLPYFSGQQDTDILSTEQINTTSISVVYQYKEGIHTYKGALELPTPCHALNTRVVSDGDTKEHVTLLFEAVSTVEVCAQVITPQTFMVAFAAEKEVSVDVSVNGKRTKLDITQLSQNESFEDF